MDWPWLWSKYGPNEASVFHFHVEQTCFMLDPYLDYKHRSQSPPETPLNIAFKHLMVNWNQIIGKKLLSYSSLCNWFLCLESCCILFSLFVSAKRTLENNAWKLTFLFHGWPFVCCFYDIVLHLFAVKQHIQNGWWRIISFIFEQQWV